MIIGFKITALGDYFDEAVAFIQQLVPLELSNDAFNIVNDWENTNVFTPDVTQLLLDDQPFDAELLYATANVTVISISNFRVELPYKDGSQQKLEVLKPAEFIDATYLQAQQWGEFITKGYIKTIPNLEGITGTGDFEPADFLKFDYNVAL